MSDTIPASSVGGPHEAPPEIALLDAAGAETALPALADLLVDAVDGGASVNFLAGLDRTTALAWWRGVLPGITSGERLVLVARSRGGPSGGGRQDAGEAALLGTVQLIMAQQPNQPHRAEIGKMLVHSRVRRRGLGDRLLAAAEGEAARRGRTLLTLDTETGSAGEALYRRRGWTFVGAIPGYALDPAGAPAAASIYYKILTAA